MLWTLLALLLAAAVMVLAGGGAAGVRRFVADLRQGLRRDEGAAEEPGLLASARRELADAADADAGTLEDLLARAEPAPDAYVRPEEIFGGLTRTTQRAVRGLAARR